MTKLILFAEKYLRVEFCHVSEGSEKFVCFCAGQ